MTPSGDVITDYPNRLRPPQQISPDPPDRPTSQIPLIVDCRDFGSSRITPSGRHRSTRPSGRGKLFLADQDRPVTEAHPVLAADTWLVRFRRPATSSLSVAQIRWMAAQILLANRTAPSPSCQALSAAAFLRSSDTVWRRHHTVAGSRIGHCNQYLPARRSTPGHRSPSVVGST